MRPQQIGQQKSRIMGRPLGARDKFPRGTGEGERIKLLETENGQLRRQIDDLKQQIEPAEHARFAGDSVELLQATQHGDYHPTWLQFRAALALWEKDWDQHVVAMDGQRVELEQERREYRDGADTLDHLIDRFNEFSRERDDELAVLLASGDVTPAAAAVIRRWFTEFKPEPELLLLTGPPEAPAQPARAPNGAAAPDPLPDAVIAPTPHAPPFLPWHELAPAPPERVLYADAPFLNFQTSSGHRFESLSDATVDIDGADPADVVDLLHAGCKQRQP